MNRPKKVIYFRGLPKGLKAAYKAACHGGGYSMARVLYSLFRLYCDDPGEVRVRKSAAVPGGDSLYLNAIPAGVVAVVKATCARRGDTMRSVAEALMTEYLENPAIIAPWTARADYLYDRR